MENKVCIRNMKEEDIPDLICSLRKLTFNQMSRDNYCEDDLNYLSEWDTSEYFNNCFKDENCYIFIAEYKDKLIGFAELWFRKKDFFFYTEDYAYMLHGFLDTKVKTNTNPVYVPFKLFKACENEAKKRGFRYIGGDVFDFNKEAKIFYNRLKYQPYRIRYMKKLME